VQRVIGEGGEEGGGQALPEDERMHGDRSESLSLSLALALALALARSSHSPFSPFVLGICNFSLSIIIFCYLL